MHSPKRANAIKSNLPMRADSACTNCGRWRVSRSGPKKHRKKLGKITAKHRPSQCQAISQPPSSFSTSASWKRPSIATFPLSAPKRRLPRGAMGDHGHVAASDDHVLSCQSFLDQFGQLGFRIANRKLEHENLL